MKETLTVAIIATTLGMGHVAVADVILGVMPSTNMGSGFGTDLENTVNGVGLIGIPRFDRVHRATTPDNSWVGDLQTTGQVTFDLGGLFTVDAIAFWNQNDGGPGNDGITGVRGVRIEKSTNGADYSPLAGAPTEFAQAPLVKSFPQIFVFGAVAATHFRFNILGNWGDPAQTGFAEVHFNSVPAAPVLAMMGLGALASGRRRRR